MATSLLSNLLYTNGSSSSCNDTDPRDNASTSRIQTNSLSDADKQQIVSLLKASTKCIEEGTCGPVVYQTMGALHQYTAMCAGLLSRDTGAAPKVTSQEEQRPAFVHSDSAPGKYSEHKDAMAYGWVEELNSNLNSNSSQDSLSSSEVAWNSVLALLVQKEKDDEPCLWITKEVLASPDDVDVDEDDKEEVRDEASQAYRGSKPSTELETLHSIPLRRRLRSCFYQNFYGDHRLVLELKYFGKTTVGASRRSPRKSHKSSSKKPSQIVLRCPSAASARAWVDCLSGAKKRKLKTEEAHVNIEVEMVDQSPSNEFEESSCDEESRHHHHHHIVNVIDSEDDNDEDYGIPDEAAPRDLPPKRLAEKLQEIDDRKRAIKLAEKQAAGLERARQQEEEEEEQREKERLELELQKRLEEEARQKEVEAEKEADRLEQKKQATIEQRKQEALERKKEEEVQRKRLEAIEKNVATIAKATTTATITTTTTSPTKPTKHKPMTAAEKQQQRMEREIAARKRAEDERRRIEIEYEQQKKERVEQRRRDLEAKRKLAREEQKRKELLQKQKFLESEQRKEDRKKAAMKVAPKKVAKGIFTAKSSSANDDATKKNVKGNLWYSLNKHMSAFETADEERKRKEEERREEEKAKAEAEEEEEDPEIVRKRIAEEARQRLVQDEVGKQKKEAEAASQRNGGGTFRQQDGWRKQRSTSPHATISPTTSQHSHQMSQASVSPPAPAHHSFSASNSVPSVPPLHHPQTQSWNKMQQPTYPQQPQQAHFQRPQPPPTGGQYHPTAQKYPKQQTPTGYPGQKQPQIPNAQQEKASHPAHQRTATPPQPPPMTQTPPPHTNEEFSGSTLKKNVLIQWGLHPPNMQVLNPVDQLLCSIHNVFPPSFGVASHEYFSGWKAISRSELVSSAGIPEESKLKKSVRKVRFFLHPDKLPKDLTEDQSFLCKLLWDVINDAFEEYKRSKEDLDWM